MYNNNKNTYLGNQGELQKIKGALIYMAAKLLFNASSRNWQGIYARFFFILFFDSPA